MGVLTYSRTLVAGANENINDVTAMFNDVAAVLNGNVDANNLANGAVGALELSEILAALLGVNTASVRRGKSIIAASGSRTNVAYGALSNGPDAVSGLVLPTDGLILASYQALWQESSVAAARAAMFIGANQLKIARDGSAPQTIAAMHGGGAIDVALVTGPMGPISGRGTSGAAADVTTGQAVGALMPISSFAVQAEVGGVGTNLLGKGGAGDNWFTGGCVAIFAAAGTYDVSVQFKASAGSVSASGRKLWAVALGF